MAEALTHNLKLIGRYSILRELRRDRTTAAYLAFDPVLDREVYLKAAQLRAPSGPPAAGDDRVDQAFTRQAQAAGRLHHPGIVTVFDAGRVQNVGYLALEKVDGPVLADALAQGFRPGPLQAADLVARVAEAVEFAHARGIPHGHLGVSRIVLQEPDRVPKVMGFGGWIDTGLTGDFELAATEAMLPYFQSELSPDARRRDVRALGALLYFLLTGTRPDPAAAREPRGGESPIVELCPAVPYTLAGIAEAALELRGLQPFASAGRMRQALLDFLHGQRAAPPPTSRGDAAPATAVRAAHVRTLDAGSARVPAPGARPRRRVARLGATVAVLAALATALAFALPDAAEEKPLARAARDTVPAPAAEPAAPVSRPAAPGARTAAQTTTFGPAPTAVANPVPPQPALRFQ
jgi:serine/threonine-protein kinase